MSFKNELMSALHDAVSVFNECRDPNDAVVKVAAERDFNAEQTRRLVETFNTARTIYHYKSAADRTQGFALADADVVIPKLFKDCRQEKAAAAEPVSYAGYDSPSRNYYNDADEYEKVAEQAQVTTGRTLEACAAAAMRELSSVRQVVKAAEDAASLAGVAASTALSKLASLLSRGWHDDITDKHARLMACGSADPELGPVVAKFAEFVNPKDTDPAKIAAAKRMHVIDDRDLVEHIEILKEAKECMEAEAEMLAAAGQLQKEADDFEREYLEALGHTFQDSHESLASFIHPELLKTAKVQTEYTQKYDATNIFGEPIRVTDKHEPATKSDSKAVGVATAIANQTFDSVKKPVQDFLQTGVERAFIAPAERENKALSERLKNTQRQILLQDLITNDPVLSEEAPEAVVNAYSALLQLAPDVAANKEIARAILRQTVHSVAVSPYDADMWTKLEQSIRNLRGARNSSAGGQK